MISETMSDIHISVNTSAPPLLDVAHNTNQSGTGPNTTSGPKASVLAFLRRAGVAVHTAYSVTISHGDNNRKHPNIKRALICPAILEHW